MNIQTGKKMNSKSRRDMEKSELGTLAKCLPLAPAITAQLDKASIIRLTSAYLTMRCIFPKLMGSTNELSGIGSLLLQTLDGFILILDSNGKMMYVSETASVHLGLAQVELIGSSIFDYLHEDDESDVRKILSTDDGERINRFLPYFEETERMFTIRMRCILPKRNAGITSGGYKTINCWGHSRIWHDMEASRGMGLVAVGYMLSKNGMIEMKLSTSSFVFRARLDLTIVFMDTNVTPLLGFDASSFLDKSFYHVIMLEDASIVERAHATLLRKNQAVTGYYRLLYKDKGYVWAQTQFCIIPIHRAIISHCIVAITEIFSLCETNETYGEIQQMPDSEAVNCDTLGKYSHTFYKAASLTSSSKEDRSG